MSMFNIQDLLKMSGALTGNPVQLPDPNRTTINPVAAMGGAPQAQPQAQQAITPKIPTLQQQAPEGPDTTTMAMLLKQLENPAPSAPAAPQTLGGAYGQGVDSSMARNIMMQMIGANQGQARQTLGQIFGGM